MEISYLLNILMNNLINIYFKDDGKWQATRDVERVCAIFVSAKDYNFINYTFFSLQHILFCIFNSLSRLLICR